MIPFEKFWWIEKNFTKYLFTCECEEDSSPVPIGVAAAGGATVGGVGIAAEGGPHLVGQLLDQHHSKERLPRRRTQAHNCVPLQRNIQQLHLVAKTNINKGSAAVSERAKIQITLTKWQPIQP